MIRVLIVEDSAVEQELLSHILGTDPLLKVVGIAKDGEMALADVERLKPDVITMDIHMPKLNGFETTRRIMESTPIPIVIVSGSFNACDADKSFRAMEAGALAIVRKPAGMGHPDYQSDAAELIKTVKAMSEIKVIRRWPKPGREAPAPPSPAVAAEDADVNVRVVAVGASTGGPAVLREIFSLLPKNMPVPMLVVQHMAAGFMVNFVKWLSESTGFPARVATYGEYLNPGCAYFAPDGFQMLVGRDNRIILSGDGPEDTLCPSVSCLFRSVAEVYGRNSMGVLLTGMGRDGADELLQMKQLGAMTVAQDQESSVVFGMPGEAVRLGATKYILAPGRIAELIKRLVR